MIKAIDFGDDFVWGIATAATQIEGASSSYGRGPSIWDTFSARLGKIKNGHRPTEACDFYHRYREDLLTVKCLGFKVFRFSISWSRLLPLGTGKVNPEGIRYYHQVIDECLSLGITPYIMLYHWDLPEALSKQGGWVSYSINHHFKEFVQLCAATYGYKVKNWMILNEPFGFTSLGYLLGIHAPGKRGTEHFFAAVHHVALAQADGARILRTEVKDVEIGTTFSCSSVIPHTNQEQDLIAARKVDALVNRLFIEPSLGMDFPDVGWDLLERFKIKYSTWRYQERMAFDFDYIGLQNYFPLVVKHNPVIPIINAWVVKAKARKMPYTAMGWEINPDSFYQIIKQFAGYEKVRKIMITENGAAFRDKITNGTVNDKQRIDYFNVYLSALLRAKNEGLPISGYFVWTLMDNFEWAEGFEARFGLVYNDFQTQRRNIKQSGYWWKSFLAHQ